MGRLLLLAAVALGLAGCGGSSDGGAPRSAPQPAEPSALAPSPAADPAASTTAAESPPTEAPATAGVTVWVTRDAGHELVLAEQVEPGLTAIQAVDVVAEIETKYGGRYVSSIDGIAGDLNGQRDWFFLVNGIEPDVGGAELRLSDGDVVWWDHRSWIESAAHPAAAIGAFPRPFHRGWKGAVRPVEVVATAALADTAAELEAFLAVNEPDDPSAKPHRFELAVEPGVEGATLSATMGSRNGAPVTFVLAGGEEAVRAAARALMASPEIVAHRYTAAFDGQGGVIDS